MKDNNPDEKYSNSSNMAVRFLETVRSRFPNSETLRIFDRCLVEYQAALLDLLMSETPIEVERESDARTGGNGTPLRLSHVQQIIADAQSFEQHQQALATYLEVRQQLKKALKQLQDFMVENMPG